MTAPAFTATAGSVWSDLGYTVSEPMSAELTRIYITEAETFLHTGETDHAMAMLKRADELLSARIAARDYRAANPETLQRSA